MVRIYPATMLGGLIRQLISNAGIKAVYKIIYVVYKIGQLSWN